MPAKIVAFLFIVLWFQQKPKTILFFGDSLTAGYGLTSPQLAFPAQLEVMLNKSGKNVDVINAGLSGETTAGGLSRIDWVLRKPIDVFVLELGANDGLRGLPLDQTEKNLQTIIDKVRAKYPKAKIVLAGMMVPPNLGKPYTDRFKKIYPGLSSKNNCLLFPFLLEGVAGNEKLNQRDGIHPNEEGHRIIAKNLSLFFQKII
ncbi:MAG: arylesterase [Bacteroidetes bacterium]|nr:arylesterase [Bacteroidota bacterium]